MKLLLILIVFAPSLTLAHPGIGIVKDSKGNIYYTDLKQVWKISDGRTEVVVPGVHTHELYMDPNDNLFGEGGMYDPRKDKHYYFLWVYRANGTFDTLISLREAYIQQDFSLARDQHGNEYYIKQFLKNPDTNHIYRRTPDGKETTFARGNFKGVKWLHPQNDGTLLYTYGNDLYRATPSGNIILVKQGLANDTPSLKFSEMNKTTWGVWQDDQRNVYVAVFSDQAVKKIDSIGNMSVYYESKGNWTPLHGVFDNENKLWVLETSDKNDIRVSQAATNAHNSNKAKNASALPILAVGIVVACIVIVYFAFRRKIKQVKNL
jgi:hypothetical protein